MKYPLGLPVFFCSNGVWCVRCVVICVVICVLCCVTLSFPLAQELLLILDEYWQSNPSLQDVPIFYASKLATKALRVYQTFVNMMNMHIQVKGGVCVGKEAGGLCDLTLDGCN